MSSVKEILNYKPNPTSDKIARVEVIKKDIEEYQNILLIGFANLPANALHELRADFRDIGTIKVVKNKMLTIAIDALYESGKITDVEKIKEKLTGATAIICTNENIFSVTARLKERKYPIAAKEGAAALSEISLESINTGISAEPSNLAEFQALGLKTRVERGTIKIMEEAVVCRLGDKVTKTLWTILDNLGIKPFEVGFEVKAGLDQGNYIGGDVLAVDFEEKRKELAMASNMALNLALFIPVVNRRTIRHLISKGSTNANELSVTIAYYTKRTMGRILAKAGQFANTLAPEDMKK